MHSMCIFKAFDKMKRLNFAMKIALKIGLCHFKIKKSKKYGERFLFPDPPLWVRGGPGTLPTFHPLSAFASILAFVPPRGKLVPPRFL